MNAEVRAKQEKLMPLSEQLSEGIGVAEATNLVGPPDMVRTIHLTRDDRFVRREYDRLEAIEDAQAGFQIEASYWPRVDAPFHGRNGQGYKVLYLMFEPTTVILELGMFRSVEYRLGRRDHSADEVEGLLVRRSRNIRSTTALTRITVDPV